MTLCCSRPVRRIAQDVFGLAPDPWDMDEFLDRLERWRGRAIDLCGIDWSPSAPTGAWQRRPDHDVIVYARNTTAWHQDIIILHELGHMLLEHRPQCVWTDSTRGSRLGAAAFHHLLGGSKWAEAEGERQAEQFARQLARWIGLRPPRQDAYTRRMAQTFG